ncbi:MAG: flippase-like domain-containing protein [Deltaproteobacteria bacterium]|nr:flippase-like domain-containing protein [Deltaproteobacteria bacterium]
MKVGFKNILVFFLRIIGLIGCFLLVFYIVDIKLLASSLNQLSGWVVLFALIIAFLRLWLVSIRWQLLNTDAAKQLSRWQYYRYMIISSTCNLFMPGALGGDIARSVLVFRTVETNRSANILAVLVDRIIGFTSIIMLGTIACLISPALPSRSHYLLFLLALIGFFLSALAIAVSSTLNHLLIKVLKQLGRWGRNLIDLINVWQGVIKFYHKNPKRMFLALLLCVPIHSSWFIIVYILARNIGIDIPFLSISMVTCLVWVISAVPLTFAGLGVRELSFVYLLSLQGITAEFATALSLHQFAIIVLVAMIGIPFIWIGNLKPMDQILTS